MGTSSHYFKSRIRDYVKRKYGTGLKILDIGAGKGTYSDLLRDLCSRIDAVEVYEPYVKEFDLKSKYDNVYVQDVVGFSPREDYDLVIMGDVLEHISVEDSKRVLDALYTKSKNIIISVPFMMEQGDLNGNQYEAHKQSDLTNEVFLSRYSGFENLYINPRVGVYVKSGTAERRRSGLKLAFLDTLGLRYNGDTLKQRGLGGSESAIIFLGQELTKLGFEVTVFNKCDAEGVYDGVEYADLNKVVHNVENFDILITSRTVLPYVPIRHRSEVLKQFPNYDIAQFKPLVDRSRHKVMWLHDTFILGEMWVEDVLRDGDYDEVFTLSDWHTQYIANARHGQTPRNYESMKRKFYQTRNGIKSYHSEVDIAAKDKNLFIYNASTTKGMVPLLDTIWPRVKSEFPDARLTIIGGYYPGIGTSSKPDQIEQLWRDKYAKHNGRDGVSFTGIIRQDQIADILLKASYFIYPGAFPETFGISATEALNCNVPLIATRFGALDETAPEATSYLIDYPITRDMRNYNEQGSVADPEQAERFLKIVREAYNNDYLRQQKMYAANEFKPYLGWDTVALQWKEHLFHKLGFYMNIDEKRKVRELTANLHRLYKRRFYNTEEILEDYSHLDKRKIAVVSPVYNAERYIAAHIASVAAQNYENYHHYIIDDLSTDRTVQVAMSVIESLPKRIRSRFTIVRNKDKRYAVGNQVETISSLEGNPIVALLDGDDFLANDPDVFNFINKQYSNGARFTYGSCHSLADKIDLIAQPYPESVHAAKSYRKHMFNWGMPYTHLRTFEKSLFDAVDKSAFRDPKGGYWKAGGDNSLFYPLIELCTKDQIRAVQRVLVVYNDLNPLNDYKVNKEEQNKTREAIVASQFSSEGSVPSKAYIIMMPKDKTSVEYAKTAAESCDRVGLKWEYFEAFDHKTPDELWSKNDYGIKSYDKKMHPGAASATASHFALWRKIRDSKETAIVLEHDAVMLQPVNVKIPSGSIVNLGYKLRDPSMYDHESAGEPVDIVRIKSHLGAHAYAIDHKTAESLLEELKSVGANNAIDNFYFSRETSKFSSVPISIVDPIAALAWVRKTTIVWDKEEAWEVNANFLPSFKANLKGDYRGEIDNNMNENINSRPAKMSSGNKTQDNLLSIDRKGLEEIRNNKSNPALASELKEILRKREDVWVDNPEADSIKFRLQWLRRRLSVIPRSSKILDIGSWTGTMANEMMSMGFSDVTCMEISEKAVALGKQTFPSLKWINSDVESHKSSGERYDVIVMMEIMEHLVDLEGTMSKVKGMLSPNGFIVFTTPTEEFVFAEGSHEHITRIDEKRLSTITGDFEKISLLKKDGRKHIDWYAGSVSVGKEAPAPSTRILIAFPTAKNIETDTFLSVYRLRTPQGVTTHLEAFYGYNIDQVRNLICYYAIQNQFDYVLFVDSDMILPADTLERLMAADRDIVTGIYIQRKPGQRITEVHVDGKNVTDPKFFEGKKFVEADSVGFGCVLVRTRVLMDVGYPQFVYHDSIDFRDTVSEDAHFCAKARERGYKVWVMTDMLFEHIASIKLKW
jgi:2-polyprenyl-3-methyl-5-hydroxy-6-metoxy-1,4-benzoquinol methylase/glycosyltransferase involved in cell wall biosynthesis